MRIRLCEVCKRPLLDSDKIARMVKVGIGNYIFPTRNRKQWNVELHESCARPNGYERAS